MQYKDTSEKLLNFACTEIFGVARSFQSEDAIKYFISEIVEDLSSNNEKLLFTNALKVKIESKIREDDSLLKLVDSERYMKFENIANWLTNYSPLDKDMNHLIKKEETLTQTYFINLAKASVLYQFCIEEEVINSSLSQEKFMEAIYSADFKDIYEGSEKKTKCKYVIYRLSLIVDKKDWYSKAAQSINCKPTECSGANVPFDWKKQVNELK